MQIVSEEAVGPTAAQVVRAARHRAGLTQREAARRVGLTQSVFSDYERGARDPSLGTLRRVIGSLGFDVSVTLVRRVTDANRLQGPIGADLLQHLEEVLAVLTAAGAARVWVVGRVVEGLEDADRDGLRFHADLPVEADVLTVMADVSEVFGFRYPVAVDVAYPLKEGGLVLPRPPFVELTGAPAQDAEEDTA